MLGTPFRACRSLWVDASRHVAFIAEGGHYLRVRISGSRAVNADRAITSPTPAWRAASMSSVWTCDTKPTVGIDASAGSPLMAATVPSGSVRALFRSKMTSEGVSFRICSNAATLDFAKTTGTPSCPAVVLILDVNIRSSTTAKITG
jgi:hypothetical protein